jgi:phage terminase small subunit
MSNNLTPKQALFVIEYLKDMNGAKAAIRAGYSQDSAKEIASENLTKLNIRAAIDEQMEARARRTLITADKILADMDRVAQRCMTNEPVMVFDKYKKRWMPLMKEVINEDGTTTKEYVYQFDSAGANKALENLARNQKLLTDRNEVGNLDGTNFEPIAVTEVFVDSPEAAKEILKDKDAKDTERILPESIPSASPEEGQVQNS